MERSYKEQPGDHVVLQLDQRINKFKIVEYLEPELSLQSKIEYFNSKKEDNMRLFFGKLLQDSSKMKDLMTSLNQKLATVDAFTYKKFIKLFKDSNVKLEEFSYKCAFVYLLRNCSEGKSFYKVPKKDLIDFL